MAGWLCDKNLNLNKRGTMEYTEETSINEWFDIYDKDHIEAYECLEITGKWPDNFIPENVVFPSRWLSDLRQSMADDWCRYIRAL